MKKLFAVFVFAVGCGASLAAVAGDRNCDWNCRVGRDRCLAQAGHDAEARQACSDWWEDCWVRCGNALP
ncbi:hypothetical protein [Pseudoduganella violaceinigra]|uniref:hypothetical protein n=1 Tax=Pseudoduganella violaceinigra TaxID=246602 RepID=UPI000412D2DB|nr:hypothetical protein [Pseudoduganella violaceinigra]